MPKFLVISNQTRQRYHIAATQIIAISAAIYPSFQGCDSTGGVRFSSDRIFLQIKLAVIAIL